MLPFDSKNPYINSTMLGEETNPYFEGRTVAFENALRAAFNIPKRTSYGGVNITNVLSSIPSLWTAQ
jgi:hypothetical protein